MERENYTIQFAKGLATNKEAKRCEDWDNKKVCV